MTPREQAVVEAARAWRDWEVDHATSMVDRNQMWDALDDAFLALDALPPAEPVGEVEVAVWEDPVDGDMYFCRAGSKMDALRLSFDDWTRIGTTRLPVIRASVASVEGEG